MTQNTKYFVLVDDDPLNNALSKMVLKRSLIDVNIQDFTEPENGLEYIQSQFNNNLIDRQITLFLDINMPSITGWEFLEEFEKFSEDLKKQFNIYILSSSIDPKDIDRAKTNPLVMDFIEKPLNKEKLFMIFGLTA